MTIVTTLTLESGDRAVLDEFVEDLRDRARRKGVELKGPHSRPPEEVSATLYDRLGGDADRTDGAWEYSVYVRRINVVGHESFARSIVDRGFPDSVRAEVEFSRQRPAGT